MNLTEFYFKFLKGKAYLYVLQFNSNDIWLW